MSNRPERAPSCDDVSYEDHGSWSPPPSGVSRAEAALAAAQNEIALLRARVARLTEANERLEEQLRNRH